MRSGVSKTRPQSLGSLCSRVPFDSIYSKETHITVKGSSCEHPQCLLFPGGRNRPPMPPVPLRRSSRPRQARAVPPRMCGRRAARRHVPPLLSSPKPAVPRAATRIISKTHRLPGMTPLHFGRPPYALRILYLDIIPYFRHSLQKHHLARLDEVAGDDLVEVDAAGNSTAVPSLAVPLSGVSACGVYFYRLSAGKFEETRKMILLR